MSYNNHNVAYITGKNSDSFNLFHKFKSFLLKEEIISFIAFAFISVSIIEILLNIQFAESEKAFPRFIANVIFLNSIHLGFTFFLIFEATPFLSWKKHLPKSMMSFHGKLVLLFVSFSIFQFFKHDMIYNIGALLVLIYATYHMIRQHLGISLILNNKYQFLNEKSKNLTRSFDHIFFATLILITWVFISLTHFSYLKNPIYIQCGYLLVIGLYIYMNYIFFGVKFLKNKTPFYLRLFIFPLLPVSFIAWMGWLSIHGMEYFFVTKQFFSFKKIRFFSLGFLLFIAIAFLCLISSHSGLPAVLDIDFPKPIRKTFWVTLGACQLLHYWIDGKIFRMKDPLIRKYIAPELKGIT
ncbi:MAG: hypothetical protein OXB86_00485 [Bdellovibrionales bacterium]|nr:hypothetical protein [Bdellovibrionales bacterium]